MKRRRTLKEYADISLDPEDPRGKAELEAVLTSDRLLHVEIGCGKAAFLLNEARLRPDDSFIGLEWAGKYYRYAVDRLGRWAVDNVRLIKADARDFLSRHMPDASVDCFHIYFSDPWPKRRHRKRRIFSDPVLDQLLRCLKPGGLVKVVTDHAEYFELIRELLGSFPGRLEPAEFEPAAAAQAGEFVGTNYERKYRREGRPIYALAVRKR